MMTGQRLHELRESKKLSQGQSEKRIALLGCPLEGPIHRLFYEADQASKNVGPSPKLLMSHLPPCVG